MKAAKEKKFSFAIASYQNPSKYNKKNNVIASGPNTNGFLSNTTTATN